MFICKRAIRREGSLSAFRTPPPDFSRETENSDYTQRRDRLRRLSGLLCPCCRLRSGEGQTANAPGKLAWNGLSLSCEAGHSYSNVDVLMQEVRESHGIDHRAWERRHARKSRRR